MITAGRREFEKAFRKHSIANKSIPQSASHYLLLFYAVECGLKYTYLRRNRLQTIDQIRDVKLRGSHDLNWWVRELRLPAAVAGVAPGFRLTRNRQEHFGIEMAHQVWRYGIAVEVSDESALLQWLRKIEQWIAENL